MTDTERDLLITLAKYVLSSPDVPYEVRMRVRELMAALVKPNWG